MDAVLLLAVFWAGVICVLSAPSDQLSACMAISQKDAVHMARCCKYAIPFTNETMMNCQKKEASGELKKEFECIPDCLFSSDGMLTGKKFDKEKWRKNVVKTVPADWKDIIANSPNECEEFEKILGPQIPKQCPTTGYDTVFNCMSVQWYLDCPKSAWTSSKPCDDTRKKFGKCYDFVFPKRKRNT